MPSRPLLAFATFALVAALASCREDAPRPVSVFSPPPSTLAPGARGPLAPGGAPTPGELPPGHPPIDAPASDVVPPPPSGAGAGSAALAWTVPPGWVTETPSSAMRRAQYKVPGPAGAGECVVFYFGPGQGGDAQSNAQRWASQFTQPGGGSSQEALRTSTLNVGDVKVLLAEVTGTYSGGMGGGGEKPGYMLLGAVAEGPDANWFFKLTGPEKTVRAQRAAFEGMIKSLKKGA